MVSVDVFAEWYCISPHGSDIWLWFALLLIIPLAVLLVAFSLAAVGLIFRKTRRPAISTMAFCAAYCVVFLACVWLAQSVRMHAMRHLAVRSRPIVNAIRQYEAYNGVPPAALADLVPKYLPAVPDTGMGAYPKYEYVSGQPSNWDENPWVLYVKTFSGGINWDIFMYFPKQNYPTVGYGEGIERIEDWAYVHE